MSSPKLPKTSYVKHSTSILHKSTSKFIKFKRFLPVIDLTLIYLSSNLVSPP
jgi:hypothetical protein